uniref:Uncharacterized protein n=1 Tax=Falco tinnunculus TaxID=100819 RepID=A0A8C4U3D3_FALTI
MVLTRLEKKNSNLAEVEVDEVLGLMSHIAAEVPSHNAVPSGIVFLIYLLYVSRLSSTLHGVLLHLFGHVRILDHHRHASRPRPFPWQRAASWARCGAVRWSTPCASDAACAAGLLTWALASVLLVCHHL